MSLKRAIDTLSDVTVTGVTKSYDLDEIRGGVFKPQLPALLPLPGEGSNERDAFGIVTTVFSERHIIRHRLLERAMQPAHQGVAMVSLVELIDNYHAAIATLSSHAGALDIKVLRYESGLVEWGGEQYYGCDFFTELWVSD